MIKFLSKLGLVKLCPVCDENQPERWMNGRAQKYPNGCCSTECWKSSKEYIAGQRKRGTQRLCKSASAAEEARAIARLKNQEVVGVGGPAKFHQKEDFASFGFPEGEDE